MQLTAAAVTPPAEHAARRPGGADAAADDAGVLRTWLHEGTVSALKELTIIERGIELKVFLSVAAVLIAMLGCAWLLFPEAMLGRWAVQTNQVGLFMGRRYGTMLLGYAVILWLSRASGPSVARTAILVGGAFVSCLIAFVSVAGILKGIVGSGAWITVVVEALLAAGFLCFLFVGRATLRHDVKS